MGQISNQIYMQAIDDGTTIHGSLNANTSLSQAYSKTSQTYSPDWSNGNGPVIFLTLLDGVTPIIPSGWDASSSSTWDAVTWIWNTTTLSFGSDQKSTNATYGGNPLFQRVTYTWGSLTVPALKILQNMALAGQLNNDVVQVNGNVEMSGSPIPFSASVTLSFGEVNANGYHGIIEFPLGSYIMNDSDIIKCVGLLYSGGKIVSNYTCRWQFNGNTVGTSTSTYPYQRQNEYDGPNPTTAPWPKVNYNELVVNGNDNTGVLDLATVTCIFSVSGKDVLTVTEVIDDKGDDEMMFTYYTINGQKSELDGSPVSLRSGQSVIWDAFIAKATAPDTIDTRATKFEFLPKNAKGTTIGYSSFTQSGSPLNNSSKYSDSWCDVTVYNEGVSTHRAQFTCHFTDIVTAGRTISGILRAIVSKS